MRLFLSAVILIHGLIHLMGFAKALDLAELSQLKQAISRPVGVLWLLCAPAFVTGSVLLVLRRDTWWWICVPAVVLSHVVIFMAWSDAKFGAVANALSTLVRRASHVWVGARKQRSSILSIERSAGY